jgi:cytochrome c oxidase subunit 2
MWKDIPLLPESASTIAGEYDLLWWFLVGLTVVFTALIFVGVVALVTIYKKRKDSPPATQIEGSILLELVWTGIPLVIVIGIFAWGTALYMRHQKVPDDAVDMYVVGKQWMWKTQHPTGVREINDLHIPVGRAIRFTMTSEDVIHSYYIPAMRVKRDVVPGRYSQMWVEPTKPGVYHLFCAEYCGTKHSQMIGKVTVMEPDEYERWLSGSTGEAPEVAGKNLFESMRCASCHPVEAGQTMIGGSPARGPSMVGLHGKEETLEGGVKVLVDDAYIRESILNPMAKKVAGYDPVMPTYAGQLGEEQIIQISAYIKSLKAKDGN